MPFLTEPPLSAPPITLSSLQFSTSLLHLKCPFASLLLAWARTEPGHPRGKHRSTRTLFGTWQSRYEGERGGNTSCGSGVSGRIACCGGMDKEGERGMEGVGGRRKNE